MVSSAICVWQPIASIVTMQPSFKISSKAEMAVIFLILVLYFYLSQHQSVGRTPGAHLVNNGAFALNRMRPITYKKSAGAIV